MVGRGFNVRLKAPPAAPWILKSTLWLALTPLAVIVTVAGKAPATVGFPLINPLVVLMLMPVGSPEAAYFRFDPKLFVLTSTR